MHARRYPGTGGGGRGGWKARTFVPRGFGPEFGSDHPGHGRRDGRWREEDVAQRLIAAAVEDQGVLPDGGAEWAANDDPDEERHGAGADNRQAARTDAEEYTYLSTKLMK